MAKKEKFCLVALIYRLQQDLKVSEPTLTSISSNQLLKLLKEKHSRFLKRYDTEDDLRKAVAKSQQISVQVLGRYRLSLDRRIPERHLRAQERFGFLPLQFVLNEAIPDQYLT
jgi:hypothetical protein